MPQRIRFSKRTIEALKPPVDGRVYVYDQVTPGLVLCLSSTGGRVFYLYRKINGRPERIKIGAWPQLTVENARDEAQRLMGRIAEGENPQERRRLQRNAPTLREVFDEYIGQPTRGKAKRPRSPKTIKDYKWQFDKHLATWQGKQVSRITRNDIEQYHAEIGADHGHYMANRMLALLKALLNYAVELGYIPVNPATRVRGFEEQSRERYLVKAEIPKFWEALEAEPTADFFKLALLTGMRQGNVIAARWEQFDLGAGTWTIPTTKNGQPLTIPLAPEAIDLLRGRMAAATGPWVFPATDNDGPMPVPRKAWERIREAAEMPDVRQHDLRRTNASWQAINGSSLTVIGNSLGHKSLEATKIYARADLEAVRHSVTTATSAILAAAKPEKNSTETEVTQVSSDASDVSDCAI